METYKFCVYKLPGASSAISESLSPRQIQEKKAFGYIFAEISWPVFRPTWVKIGTRFFKAPLDYIVVAKPEPGPQVEVLVPLNGNLPGYCTPIPGAESDWWHGIVEVK